MRKHTGWLGIIASFGLLAAANAQAPTPSTATTQFDGTYAFVSATKVNETYTTRVTNRLGRCGDYRGRPLTIANGQARYPGLGRVTSAGFEGTVGPHGELALRLASTPATRGATPGVEIVINGRIESDGTVRARQMGYACSYDLVWQKQAK